MGVHVIPYLNGRLWNIDTDVWHTQGAARWACRFEESASGEPYRYYIEPYKERPFVPMCPATEFLGEDYAKQGTGTLELRI